MACSGCGGPCPPCPQSIFVHTLDPDCPVDILSGFTDVLTKVVPIPAGLPSFGIVVVADLLAVNGVGGASATEYRIVDVAPDGFTTTVMRTKTISIPASAEEDLAIIGGLNNLSAGNHTIKLQVDASAAPFTVPSAGMRIDLVQMTNFVVDEEACDVG